jgi:putative membrane protein
MRLTTGIALVGACTLIVACSKGDSRAAAKADSLAMADTAARPAAVTTPAEITPPPAQLTDTNLVAILDNANASDSAAGRIASEKGTSADVKDFGNMMMRDHHALRKAGQDLAKKLNIRPIMPIGDSSATAAQHWRDRLNAMPAGVTWDKAYIDHEVSYHQSLLQTANAAQSSAQDTSLQAFVIKAGPSIQAHLDKAQSIQVKLDAAMK